VHPLLDAAIIDHDERGLVAGVDAIHRPDLWETEGGRSHQAARQEAANRPVE
jgi:hypothetical protein